MKLLPFLSGVPLPLVCFPLSNTPERVAGKGGKLPCGANIRRGQCALTLTHGLCKLSTTIIHDKTHFEFLYFYFFLYFIFVLLF